MLVENVDDIEKSLIGTVLLYPKSLDDLFLELDSTDFNMPILEQIWETIDNLRAEKKPVDVETVAYKMGDRLIPYGGKLFLADLLHVSTMDVYIPEYAKIIKEESTRRKAIALVDKIKITASDRDQELAKAFDQASKGFFDLQVSQKNDTVSKFSDVFEEICDYLQSTEESLGVAVRVPGLQDSVDLFRPGQMVVVAARPGVGKTTLALQFLRDCVFVENKPAAMFSLEMSKNEIGLKILSAEANVYLSSLYNKNLGETEWARIQEVYGKFMDAPLFLDDSASLTMDEICVKARQLKVQNKIELIIIDYLQLLRSGKKFESRQVEVSEFSRKIKLLAKELQIPVVALSQLNRGLESRAEKRPVLTDLRESGSIEQDADVVILLNELEDQGIEYIIAKNRAGNTAIQEGVFNKGRSYFM